MTSTTTEGSILDAGAWPADPIAAATFRADPFPYYAALAKERPVYRDEKLGLWVVSSHAAVTAVLTSAICHVRPPAEPVPRAIAGTFAGEVFRQLVRQNDGASHCPFKKAIVATLGGLDPKRLTEHAEVRARALIASFAPQHDRAGLTRFVFAHPVQTVASLLGVPAARLDEVTDWARSLVIAFSPFADAPGLERGKAAAEQLLALFNALLDARGEPNSDTLFGALAQQAAQFGRDDREVIIANGVGFLSQTYEATAGLIGNSLLALSDHVDVRASVDATPDLIGDLIEEVLLLTPPTHNTRRFLAEDGVVAGVPMRAGDGILVLLAAASRDIVDDAWFDLHRTNRRIIDFGAGVHTCPADRTAPLIAAVAIRELLNAGVDLVGLRPSTSYWHAPNVRAPMFTSAS